MTGFELHRTHHHINNINKIALQITAKPGKKYANPQPVATKNPAIKTHLRPTGMNHERACFPPARHHHITQKVCIAGQRTLYLSVHKDPFPAEIVLQVKGTDCTQETIALYRAVAQRVSSQVSMGDFPCIAIQLPPLPLLMMTLMCSKPVL